MRKGVYYIKSADKLVYLSNIKTYEDLTKKFCIVNWEDDSGIYKKTLIERSQFSRFKYIGSL